ILSPCRIHTPPRQTISRPSNVLTPCITTLKSLRIGDRLRSPDALLAAGGAQATRGRACQQAGERIGRPAVGGGDGHSQFERRHPELVSGSISPPALSGPGGIMDAETSAA